MIMQEIFSFPCTIQTKLALIQIQKFNKTNFHACITSEKEWSIVETHLLK
jgi:hypothetical protein